MIASPTEREKLCKDPIVTTMTAETKNLIKEEDEVEVNDGLDPMVREPLLSHTLKEVGSYGDDVAAIEVWLYDSGTGTLNRPYSSSSWWTNTKLLPPTDSLRMMNDPTHPNYEEPSPCPPGCDLAGILWTNTSTTSRTRGGSHFFTSTKRGNYDDDDHKGSPSTFSTQSTTEIKDKACMGVTVSFLVDTPSLQNPVLAPTQQDHNDELEEGKASPESTIQDSINSTTNASRKRNPSMLQSIFQSAMGRRPQNPSYFVPNLVYRDINSILYNIDDAKSHRLLQLKNAGFTYAAGIRFTTSKSNYLYYKDADICGIVIYYFGSTSTTAAHGLEYPTQHYYDLTTIEGKRAQAKEQYLLQSTEYIGSTLAFIHSRTVLCQYTITTNAAAKQRFDGDRISMTDTSADTVSNCHRFHRGIQTWWNKCHGANLQIPPAFSWAEGKNVL